MNPSEVNPGKILLNLASGTPPEASLVLLRAAAYLMSGSLPWPGLSTRNHRESEETLPVQ